MSNKSNIDKRTINITIHLKSERDWKSVTYEVHEYLKAITTKTGKKLPLKYTPSLISSLDFEGSRAGISSNQCPHLHIVAMLASPPSEGSLSDIVFKLNQSINANIKVNLKNKNAVQIRTFEDRGAFSRKEQITNIIDYNRKSELNKNNWLKEDNVLVLPYYDIMTSSNDNLLSIKSKLKSESDAIYKNIGDVTKHHLYFSQSA